MVVTGEIWLVLLVNILIMVDVPTHFKTILTIHYMPVMYAYVYEILTKCGKSLKRYMIVCKADLHYKRDGISDLLQSFDDLLEQ
jgi:hypothetical protein